ncbi:MAG: hypothetical protein M1828_001041 [Chrysothrix sp. TS-e1954]|nr:MAG: hypothetical protein M1828_001041 [Chrysothrix sp. TS-e1954]
MATAVDAATVPTNERLDHANDVQPDSVQPGDAQPNTAQPNTAQPNNAQPNNAQPNNAQPADAQTAQGLPTARTQQGYAQPARYDPETDRPSEEFLDSSGNPAQGPLTRGRHNEPSEMDIDGIEQEAALDLQAEGAINQGQAAQRLPDDILTLYRTGYAICRSKAWESGKELTLEDQRPTQNAIENRNKAHNLENFEQDYFPFPEVCTAAAEYKGALEKYDAAGQQGEKIEIAKTVLERFIFVSEKLYAKGIPWKLVCPRSVRSKLQELAKEVAPTYRGLTDGAYRQLCRPTLRQLDAITQEFGNIMNFSKALSDNNVQGALGTLESMSKLNEGLRTINEKEGLKREDHLVPVAGLKDKLKAALASTDEAARAAMVSEITKGMATFLTANHFPIREDTVQNDDQTQLEDEATYLINNAVSENDAGANVESSPPLRIQRPDGTLRGRKDFASLSEFTRASKMPAEEYQNFKTKKGEMKHFRRVGHGHRIWLFAGTANSRFWNISNGTQMGLRKFKPDPDMLLARPKKGRTSDDIIEVLDILTVPYQKQEKSPHYFLMSYKSEPFEEWLTKTELAKFWDARKIEDMLEIGLHTRTEIAADLAECKEKGIHPDTLEPLTEEQKRESPWL